MNAMAWVWLCTVTTDCLPSACSLEIISQIFFKRVIFSPWKLCRHTVTHWLMSRPRLQLLETHHFHQAASSEKPQPGSAIDLSVGYRNINTSVIYTLVPQLNRWIKHPQCGCGGNWSLRRDCRRKGRTTYVWESFARPERTKYHQLNEKDGTCDKHHRENLWKMFLLLCRLPLPCAPAESRWWTKKWEENFSTSLEEREKVLGPCPEL